MRDAVYANDNHLLGSYLSRMENAEREHENSCREALQDVKSESYFRVALDEFLDHATPEEVVRLYTLCPSPVWSDDPVEIGLLSDVYTALHTQKCRKTFRVGTDEYLTEEAFRYIPAKVLVKLQRNEAERRAGA
jgi:hypothetical protein